MKTAINAIFDHLIEALDFSKITKQDFYWDHSCEQLFDMSKKTSEPAVGRLSDDVGFIKGVRRGEGGDVAYNLVHIFPLLHYIAENIKS